MIYVHIHENMLVYPRTCSLHVNYLSWMEVQSWIDKNYSHIYTIIINNIPWYSTAGHQSLTIYIWEESIYKPIRHSWSLLAVIYEEQHASRLTKSRYISWVLIYLCINIHPSIYTYVCVCPLTKYHSTYFVTLTTANPFMVLETSAGCDSSKQALDAFIVLGRNAKMALGLEGVGGGNEVGIRWKYITGRKGRCDMGEWLCLF